MGNCTSIPDIDYVQQPQPKELTETQPSVPIGEIFNDKTRIIIPGNETEPTKYFYYIKGEHIKYIECPFAKWHGVATFGHTLGCFEREEPTAFAIICFSQHLTTYANFFTSYLGHAICKYCANLEIDQNVVFVGVPVKTISDKIRNLSNVYVDYLDTNLSNKKNKILGVGSDIINILQTNASFQHHLETQIKDKKKQYKPYSYIHLDSIPRAYTFYIKNKFENITIDDTTSTLVQYPSLWGFNDEKHVIPIYYFNTNSFMKEVSFDPLFPQEKTLTYVLQYCQDSIIDGIFLAQQQRSHQFSLIGCICFLPSMGERHNIYEIKQSEQAGGIVKDKILYKGYYFTVRRDRYGKYIYSQRIGRVSYKKAMRSS